MYTPKNAFINLLEKSLNKLQYEVLIKSSKPLLSDARNIKFFQVNSKNKKEQLNYAVNLAKYENMCVLNNLSSDLRKLPQIIELLSTYDIITGHVNPHGFTFYTKFVNKKKDGFFVLKKQTYLRHKDLVSIKNVGYVNVIPMHEAEKHLVPKLFKPVSDMFSFLVYPHHSEIESVNISVDKKDFLFIPHIHSAKKILTLENIGFFGFLGIMIFLLSMLVHTVLGIAPITLFMFLCSIFYFTNWTFKVYLAYKTLISPEETISEKELANLDGKNLPVYTILVPLYKESGVLKQLVDHIKKINWPKNKLDVKLLLEGDDIETIEATKSINLPQNFEVVILAHSFPKGKPKALNHGFLKSKGVFTVIYDAEDIMEPDQLKKAYLTFQNSPPTLRVFIAN